MVGYVLIGRWNSSCSYCGANITESFKGCTRCGTRFKFMVPTYCSGDDTEMEREFKADPRFAHLTYVSPKSPDGLAAMRS